MTTILRILISPLTYLWYGFATSKIWSWLIVPIFELQEYGTIAFASIFLVTALFRIKSPTAKEVANNADNDWQNFFISLFVMASSPAIMMLVAKLFQWWFI